MQQREDRPGRRADGPVPDEEALGLLQRAAVHAPWPGHDDPRGHPHARRRGTGRARRVRGAAEARAGLRARVPEVAAGAAGGHPLSGGG